ncbi:hypothetical protein ACODT3_42600 [Streptomyces sp. 4.24]|uniref:hypothetical protein n=1 Tax=Streptomyces tritrimontium TaxID=3406573 RepID=UPI003BB6A894
MAARNSQPKPRRRKPAAPTAVAISAPDPAVLDEARATAAGILAEAEQLAGAKVAEATQEAEKTVESLLDEAQQQADTLRADAEVATNAVRADAEAVARQLQDTARKDAEQLLDEARAEADRVQADATAEAEDARGKAASDAARHMEAAVAEAERLRAEAAEAADRLRVEAKTTADELVAQALAEADTVLGKARAEAGRIRSDAEQALARGQQDAARIREEAVAEADRLREAGRADRERALDEAQSVRTEADQLRAHALRTAESLRDQAEETAARIRGEATTDATRVREDAVAEAERQRAGAHAMVTEAEKASAQLLTRAQGEAAGIVARATTKADGLTAQATADLEAATKTRTRVQDEADALLDTARKEREQAAAELARALDPTVQALQKRTLKDDAKERRRSAKRNEKVQRLEEDRERRATRKAGQPTILDRIRKFFQDNARRLMVVGPITAPMAVAWSSQTSYAMDAFGWWLPFALGFAAAWELTTTFTGWMYHQARSQGDSGLIYRVMTWVFAAGAAAMNYAHHCGPGGKPTQAAVAFATMSIVGMILWELYANLLHREHARKQGRVAKARPHIGLIRWMRYPQQSWTAWSLTINDEALDTVEKAWAAAGRHLAEAERVRQAAGLGAVRKRIAAAIGVGGWVPVRGLPPVPRTWRVLPAAGSASPAAVPQFAVTLVREPARTGLAGGSANSKFAEISEPALLPELEPANRATRTGEPQRERTEREGEPRTGEPQREVAAEPRDEPRTSGARSNPQPASAPSSRGPANLTDRAAQHGTCQRDQGR